jgi:glycerophosphoryl diester phosphodiesterase
MGADGVELDLHQTADRALVVHHDEMVGPHHIAHCSLREIRSQPLRNGETVPTLDEALAVILPRMRAFVEIKSLAPAMDEALFASFDRTGHADSIAVHSFDHRIVHRLGEKRPALKRGVLLTSHPVKPVRMMEDADASVLWQHVQQLDESLVKTLHEAGLTIYVWTVDGPAALARMVRMGVDGICTNHPDRGRQAVDSHAL